MQRKLSIAKIAGKSFAQTALKVAVGVSIVVGTGALANIIAAQKPNLVVLVPVTIIAFALYVMFDTFRRHKDAVTRAMLYEPKGREQRLASRMSVIIKDVKGSKKHG